LFDGALSPKLHYLQGEALPLEQCDLREDEASWLADTPWMLLSMEEVCREVYP
jgi:hypothetical protein